MEFSKEELRIIETLAFTESINQRIEIFKEAQGLLK